MAISLTLDNRRARPERYAVNRVVQATYAARTMRMSGVILLAFIFFHLAHFTARSVPGMEYNDPAVLSPNEVPLVKYGEAVLKDGEPIMTFNVNDMMVAGFQNIWVLLLPACHRPLHAPRPRGSSFRPSASATPPGSPVSTSSPAFTAGLSSLCHHSHRGAQRGLDYDPKGGSTEST